MDLTIFSNISLGVNLGCCVIASFAWGIDTAKVFDTF